MLGGGGFIHLANQLREKNRAILEKVRDRNDRLNQVRYRIKREFRFKSYSPEYKQKLHAQLVREKRTRKIISVFAALMSVGISALIFWVLFL